MIHATLHASLQIQGANPGRIRRLYDYVRLVRGSDLPNYPQTIGDSVGFVYKNVAEYLQGVDLALRGDVRDNPHAIRLIDPSFTYAVARTEFAKGQLKGDGATGAAGDAAFRKYGPRPLPASAYDGRRSQSWGDEGAPGGAYRETLSLIGSSAAVKTVDEVAEAVYHGYPVALFSGRYGFAMLPDADGFHRPSGSAWNHGYTVIATSRAAGSPHAFELLNCWSDVHGKLPPLDGVTPPPGVLRVTADVLHEMLVNAGAECFAYSGTATFTARAEALDALLIQPQ